MNPFIPWSAAPSLSLLLYLFPEYLFIAYTLFFPSIYIIKRFGSNTKTFIEHSQATHMELFGKLVNSWKLLVISAKSSTLDVWVGSKWAPEIFSLLTLQFLKVCFTKALYFFRHRAEKFEPSSPYNEIIYESLGTNGLRKATITTMW